MTDMVGSGSDFIRDLGDAARRNPMSAALIGMGIVWLFAGGKAGVGPGDLLQRTGVDRIPEAAKDTFNTARDGVASAANSAAEAIRESEYAKLLPDSTNVLDNVRSNLSDLFKGQPLALGAIGLAIGAGIAAALPNTELENSYLGDTSESLKKKAADIADEQIEKAGMLATDVVEATTGEARKEGLTLDGARAAMDDLSGKLGRVVGAAGKNLSENVR
jgi:hypothetical protein